MVQARKFNQAMRCMLELERKRTKDRLQLEESFRKPVKRAVEGKEITVQEIPDSSRQSFQAAIDGYNREPVTVEFDYESVATVKQVAENIFERDDVKEKGLAGEARMAVEAILDDCARLMAP